MSGHVCPWWGGCLIDNPLRRLLHNPERILRSYARPGMTAMDVGCGRGMFSIALAKMVGPEGRVIAVDLQPQMLDAVRRRAEKAGLIDRIQLHHCQPDRLGIQTPVDFALAFAMIHEVPDARRLLTEIASCLNPGGKLLIAEPRLHVPAGPFQATLAAAREVGLDMCDEPPVRLCRAAVLIKPKAGSA